MHKSIETKYLINKVHFIVSLSGNHLESAEDLYKYHIIKYFTNSEFHVVNSREELLECLEKIEEQTADEIFPLIHIESHGLQSGNGIELLNKEQLHWEELRSYFTAINIKCCNNLSLCISACNSMYIVGEMVKPFYDSMDAQVPFFCFVGTERTVDVDELILAFPVFYAELSESKNLNKAVLKMNEEKGTTFRYDMCYAAFRIIISKFADTWIKNRVKLLSEDPDLLESVYCPMYLYTYGKECDYEAIREIMISEQFYLDYLNKRQKDYLMTSICDENEERFPKIDKLENFEKSIPILRTLMR